jgi:hypothetical protein
MKLVLSLLGLRQARHGRRRVRTPQPAAVPPVVDPDMTAPFWLPDLHNNHQEIA